MRQVGRSRETDIGSEETVRKIMKWIERKSEAKEECEAKEEFCKER